MKYQLPYAFVCSYCNKPVTIVDNDYHYSFLKFYLNDSNYGDNFGLNIHAIRCPNEKCKKVSLRISLSNSESYNGNNFAGRNEFHKWNLLPDSNAMPLPDYIPKTIVEDYNEACKILNLSPKASATLARRCLQGMIRDFWDIKKDKLIDEINELEGKIDPEVWDSIDHVRKIGNIGAHMEKDINLIIDLSPEEANALVELLELLFEEWYKSRHKRQERLAAIKKIGEEKEVKKKAKKN